MQARTETKRLLAAEAIWACYCLEAELGWDVAWFVENASRVQFEYVVAWRRLDQRQRERPTESFVGRAVEQILKIGHPRQIEAFGVCRACELMAKAMQWFNLIGVIALLRESAFNASIEAVSNA